MVAGFQFLGDPANSATVIRGVVAAMKGILGHAERESPANVRFVSRGRFRNCAIGAAGIGGAQTSPPARSRAGANCRFSVAATAVKVEVPNGWPMAQARSPAVFGKMGVSCTVLEVLSWRRSRRNRGRCPQARAVYRRGSGLTKTSLLEAGPGTTLAVSPVNVTVTRIGYCTGLDPSDRARR